MSRRSAKLADMLFGLACNDVMQKSWVTVESSAMTLLQAKDKNEALLQCERETNNIRNKITTEGERKFMLNATILWSLLLDRNKFHDAGILLDLLQTECQCQYI